MENYKPVPLVNSKGEKLAACQFCSLNGPLIVCRKVDTTKSGKRLDRVRSVPKKRQNTYIRNGWKVTPFVCETCGGAGLYPVKNVAS